jgi:hypothetical protein
VQQLIQVAGLHQHDGAVTIDQALFLVTGSREQQQKGVIIYFVEWYMGAVTINQALL